MDDSSPITPEFHEDLVAYLDGELDDVATIEVERSLSESAEVRQEVEALSRTWDLLNTLPEVEASSEFTQRTMASIQTASLPEKTQPLFSREAKRQLLISLGLCGVVFFAVAGFFIARQGFSQPSDPIVKDLPVLEKLELYEEVGELKFLKQLEELGPLNDGKLSGFQDDYE